LEFIYSVRWLGELMIVLRYGSRMSSVIEVRVTLPGHCTWASRRALRENSCSLGRCSFFNQCGGYSFSV